MRLRPEQLAGHLAHSLLPIYLVSGEEPLQHNEAADAIRAAARAQGYTERQVLEVEGDFDWNALGACTDNLSLFAERRLVELRLSGAKLGTDGPKVLSAYAEQPPPDNLLLITCGKLDKQQQKSKWFGALERAGVVLQVWPPKYHELPAWMTRRLRAHGFEPTPEAVALLVERVEGNLLAAAQEIEKLSLLHAPGVLDERQVRAAVTDSARYDVFGLADAALEGDAARCARMLDGLRGEGEAPVLVLWALVREVRILAQMAAALANGAPREQLLVAHKVWDERKPRYRAALGRHTVARWRALLRRAARVERVAKGVEQGNPWDELLQLSLFIAGVRLV